PFRRKTPPIPLWHHFCPDPPPFWSSFAVKRLLMNPVQIKLSLCWANLTCNTGFFHSPFCLFAGKVRTRGIGGGHKQKYRWVDFQRLRYEANKEGHPFEEKVVEVRYDPCRSADIALLAGGNRKRWIIATENMQAGDIIKTSGVIGRMAVSANEGDAYPLGALPVGTLVNNLELQPGRGSECIRAAGTSGVLLRKVNGTAIVQLPSKQQVQVLESCMVTVGRVSNIDHNKRVIGKAGRNRWLGIRPSSGLWKRKGGWAGRKIKPLPPMKSYVNLPLISAS
uniref:Large ribosomal subunit protein uL2m n=1 Tax=Fundulus heteroclitus TaxID=8078 RepID=A0A3Q2NQL2_FUNHE